MYAIIYMLICIHMQIKDSNCVLFETTNANKIHKILDTFNYKNQFKT